VVIRGVGMLGGTGTVSRGRSVYGGSHDVIPFVATWPVHAVPSQYRY